MATKRVNSRRKGKEGELEVAKLLRSFGFDSHRGVQYKGGPDSPDVTGLPGVHIEVKRTNKFDLYGALRQSQRDASETEVPIVIHRRDRESWVVVLSVEDYIDLYKKANGIERESSTEDNEREADQET